MLWHNGFSFNLYYMSMFSLKVVFENSCHLLWFFCSMTFRHFKMWLKWINIFWGHFSALFKVLKRCIWEICQFKSLFTLHIASKQLCRVDVKASTFSILQLGDTFLWGDYAFCYFGHLWWHQNTVFRCNMLMNWYPWSCILY